MSGQDCITTLGGTVKHLSACSDSLSLARARFLAKVDTSGGPDACHPWTETIDKAGYGRTSSSYFGTPFVHRIAWTLANGPIPDGLDIDHVRARGCRMRHCCNVRHLEPVTHFENCRRGSQAQQTHCVNGHPFNEENTVIRFRKDGVTPYRQCRPCVTRRSRRRKPISGIATRFD